MAETKLERAIREANKALREELKKFGPGGKKEGEAIFRPLSVKVPFTEDEILSNEDREIFYGQEFVVSIPGIGSRWRTNSMSGVPKHSLTVLFYPLT